MRLNIRPFVIADVLRKRPKIKWGIDRGNNPPGSLAAKPATTTPISRWEKACSSNHLMYPATDMMQTPSHMPEFKSWLVNQEHKATGTAAIYANQLKRCAKFYGVQIDALTVRSDADVQRIIADVTQVVLERDRWVKGALNIYDVRRNLVFALEAYSRFIRAKFQQATASRSGEQKKPAVFRSRTRSPSANTEPRVIGLDMPTDEIPKRMLGQISRIVRNSVKVQEIKAIHEHRCQVCGMTLELFPRIFYSEGHHLKPLGTPHNGPDVKENILCVCPNCHVKLDFAALRINNGSIRVANGHSIGQEFIEYHNSLYDSGTTS